MRHIPLMILAFCLLDGVAMLLDGCNAPAVSPQNQAIANTIDARAAAFAGAVSAGCQEAAPLLTIAALVPKLNTVAAGIQIGCNTDAGLARLLADPSSATWLGEQVQIIKTGLGSGGFKVWYQ